MEFTNHGSSNPNHSTNSNLYWGFVGRTFKLFKLHKGAGSYFSACCPAHLSETATPPYGAQMVQTGILARFVERFKTRVVKKVRYPPIPRSHFALKLCIKSSLSPLHRKHCASKVLRKVRTRTAFQWSNHRSEKMEHSLNLKNEIWPLFWTCGLYVFNLSCCTLVLTI